MFKEMLATGLTPSIVTYNTVLASCAARGAWWEALDLLANVFEARADGVSPNTSEPRPECGCLDSWLCAGSQRLVEPAAPRGSRPWLMTLPLLPSPPCSRPLLCHAATFSTCLAAVAKGASSIPPNQHAAVASRALQARASTVHALSVELCSPCGPGG